MSIKRLGIKSNMPAQAMAEFALVLPILLLVVYGMLEVGRLIFTYSTIISAAREGMRYGSATGALNPIGTEQYKDCQGIKNRAQNVDFLNSFDDSQITISYDHGPGTSSFGPCSSGLTVADGDRIIVSVSADFIPLVGIVPLSPMHISSTSERTLLVNVTVAGPTATAGPPPSSYNLFIHLAGSKVGTVSSSPVGTGCGIDCFSFPTGTSVTLTAHPDGSSAFTGWMGSCIGVGTCTLTMNMNKTVWAYFDEKPSVTLIVSKTGAGSGKVTSSPLGINCGTVCNTFYLPSTTVTLTATADINSYFSGWSGCDSVAGNTCNVKMDKSKNPMTVTAQFVTSALKTLSVSKTGTGTGTITSVPTGISCGLTCLYTFYAYPTGTSVTLTAAQNTDSTFSGWTGCDSVAGNNCTVALSISKSVTANFVTTNATLSVGTAGFGTGSVTMNPVGVDCGAGCYSYSIGTSVTLTAAADTGSTFASWSGACSGELPTCTITMNGPKSVVANFDSSATRTLSVTLSGTGSGTITSTPTGIYCGSTCVFPFDANITVTLTAIANSDSTFTGWSGGGCSGDSPTCTITMDAAKWVTATFYSEPCSFTQSTPVYVNGDKTITWNIQNTAVGTSPALDHLVVFWDGGYLQYVTFDTSTLWSGYQSPTTFSISGRALPVTYGSHSIVFSFPAPETIVGNNFNATLYFVPTNCPVISTGSWTVK